ncbi:MAG: hypothetical protein ABIG89_06890 [Candidatus Woesearchaeota archaeon]
MSYPADKESIFAQARFNQTRFNQTRITKLLVSQTKMLKIQTRKWYVDTANSNTY